MTLDARERLLLVRNGYGRRDLWVLPGGGVKRSESLEDAAQRELMEEVACRLDALCGLGMFRSSAEGRRDTVHLFRATTVDAPCVDGTEVIEAKFFAFDALPPSTSSATLRRVAELRGERVSDGRW